MMLMFLYTNLGGVAQLNLSTMVDILIIIITIMAWSLTYLILKIREHKEFLQQLKKGIYKQRMELQKQRNREAEEAQG